MGSRKNNRKPRRNLETVEMPFGRHRGECVDGLQTGYLIWLWRKKDLYGLLERAVGEVLSSRGVVFDRRGVIIEWLSSDGKQIQIQG